MRFRVSPRLPARDVPTHFGSPSPSIATVHAYTLSPPASSIADRRTATYCPGSARDLRRAVKVPTLSIGPRFPSFRGSLARWIGVADGAATRHGHPAHRPTSMPPFPFHMLPVFFYVTCDPVGSLVRSRTYLPQPPYNGPLYIQRMTYSLLLSPQIGSTM
ncbi:hypothetical protein C8F04DRAFT_1077832 [Mycena alexandri]|uniref:Uncharacterized protein n=1 Tax=Mycena alexandri TaxID=1745969 RepID=A0AAD6TAR9_9AGAR|nr:hypothetical protein C8F04DRAFT_1077832 [Mycena alexandri]